MHLSLGILRKSQAVFYAFSFFWLDGFAALISVPLFVWLGHWLWARFHADLAELHRAMERAQSYALWGTLLVVALIVLAILLWRRRRKSA